MQVRIYRIREVPAVPSPATFALLWAFLLSAFLCSAVFASGMSYTPRIKGAPDQRIHRLLEDAADTFTLRESPPASVELLRKRARGDAARMEEILKSEGYYGGEVAQKVAGGGPPVEVLFEVRPGPLYTIESLDLQLPSGASPFQTPALEGEKPWSLEPGDPARAGDVLDARGRLVQLLKNHGYPFAEADRPRAFVDHSARSVRIEQAVKPGPRARFGRVVVSGLERVEEPYVLGKLAWKEGDLFNASLLEQTRDRLIGTGLFATADVKSGESLDAQERVPVHLRLKERKPRTVAFGLRYRTDEGPGARGSWKHRNIFGRAERLSLDATVSPDLLGLDSVFRKPEFLRPDQSLLVEAGTGTESPDAYTSRSFRTAVGLEREISNHLMVGGGLALKVSRVDQLGEEEHYGLISLPLRLDADKSDDLLNPQQGWRLALRLTPFVEVLEEKATFTRGYARLTHYLRLMQDPGLVLATRWGVGAIVGAERDRIPADERFYAGGGGSVRGLPYQSAGPLEGGDPVGGRSLLEVSAELRLRLSSSLGLVGFIDGGRAFEDEMPGSGGSMLWGAGVGVRYFTFLGPLRLDVAVPLDRREGVDDAFQFYVSIGQAF